MLETRGQDDSGPLTPTRINLVTGALPPGLVANNLAWAGEFLRHVINPPVAVDTEVNSATCMESVISLVRRA